MTSNDTNRIIGLNNSTNIKNRVRVRREGLIYGQKARPRAWETLCKVEV
jgi:hypothetical protein